MEEIIRIRMPKGNEVLGVIEEVLGASRFNIKCKDGKKRICRIPGKHRKIIRMRVGYIVIVKPWDIEPDEKGDIVWIYNKTHSSWLRSKGFV